jgi:C4-dicarboxylate-specific signal transduction histidine kinase
MLAGGSQKDYLAIEEHLPEFDWTLVVTADLAPAQHARWTAITLGALLSAALLFGGLFWRQRETRMHDLRRLGRELESRVTERTRDLAEADFMQWRATNRHVCPRPRGTESSTRHFARLPRPPNPGACRRTIARKKPKSTGLITRPPSGPAALTGYEARYRHRDGHDLYMMVFTAPLIDGDGKHTGWMSSMVDITAQKRAEEQWRQQAIQMQRTGRLANMGEMASTLAHELSQPLMALVNYAGAAKGFSAKGHTELLNETLSDISEQAQRAAEIIARIRGLCARRPRLSTIISTTSSTTFTLMRPEAPPEIRIVTRMPDGLPLVNADRVLLEQVVLNLILNAMRAMGDNTRSTVS